MWIERLTLDDFGCFHDARLEPLDDGLNVIAGPQRAGKTTLMEGVRRLGYGIGRGDDLPPSADRYSVRATVVHDGYEYEIELDHYADPRVTTIDDGAPELAARELFGDVREEQYRQLYTISLDELRRDPRSLEGDVDISRILLGAGFGEASDIPDLVDDLDERAHDIGRTTGSQGGPIRDAIRTVEDGLDAKEQAVGQVEEYEETRAELAEKRDRIEEIDSAVDESEDEATRLELVHSEYQDYERLLNLRRDLDEDDLEALDAFPLGDLERVRALAEQYEDAREEHRSARSDFESTVSVEDPDAYCERLLSERDAIGRYENERSGHENQVEQLAGKSEQLEADRSGVNEQIANLHPEWETEEDVAELDTDLFTEAEVRQPVEEYEDADDRCDEFQDRIQECSGEIKELGERIESAVDRAETTLIREYAPHVALGVAGSVAAGAVASTASSLVGVVVTAVVLLVVGSYLFRAVRPGEASHEGVNVEHLRAQRQDKEGTLATLEDNLSAAEDRRDDALERLEEVVDEYDLPDDTPPRTLKQFYDELLEITGEIADLERREERLEEERNELREELREVADDLEAIGVLDDPIKDPLDSHSTLFVAVDRAASHLDAATDVEAAESEVRHLEQEFEPYLEQWEYREPPAPGDEEFPEVVSRFLERGAELEDVAARRDEWDALEEKLAMQLENGRVSAAFDPTRDELDDEDPDPLDAFDVVYDEYESADAIQARLETIRDEIEELEGEKEDLQQDVAELENDLDDLASDEDVHEAHETIQKGRSQLENRLEEYAQYRIAEHLLEQLHEKYLDRTTGPLLEEASDIFRRITNGTYEHVRSRDEFEDLDFETDLADGGRQHSGELSRATKEQLFLAVRLAKIKLEDEPLPALIDDSLTNFDPGHVHRTVEVVSELADEQQVLLLTCHPTMLDQVDAAHEATYWTLDGGEFGDPSTKPADAHDLLERQMPMMYSDPELEQ